ncbi:hypothetical protein C0993_001118 [Termitomyces sp. T159_Od127]|nr:hypothetical protein C0993_001118 [Termitomyces sp. T159_Od127]
MHVRVNNPVFAEHAWFMDAIVSSVDLRSLVSENCPLYKLVAQLHDAEERDLPPTPGDEFSVFAASMKSRPVPFYNMDQVTESKFKILLSY